MELLRAGASAMDAVEVAVRVVEANEADHYVGVGGLPNLLGESSSTRRSWTARPAGPERWPRSPGSRTRSRSPEPSATGCRSTCCWSGPAPSSSPTRSGIERGETLTDEARKMWREGLEPERPRGRSPSDRATARWPTGARCSSGSARWSRRDGPWGTVNVLALDAAGNLAVAVSTSGYPWKYPGRVGDSALIGAGNYCDNRVRRGCLHRPRRAGDPRQHRPRGAGLALKAGLGPGRRRARQRWPRRSSCPTSSVPRCRCCA